MCVGGAPFGCELSCAANGPEAIALRRKRNPAQSCRGIWWAQGIITLKYVLAGWGQRMFAQVGPVIGGADSLSAMNVPKGSL